jgi:hypothetical protein
VVKGADEDHGNSKILRRLQRVVEQNNWGDDGEELAECGDDCKLNGSKVGNWSSK